MASASKNKKGAGANAKSRSSNGASSSKRSTGTTTTNESTPKSSFVSLTSVFVAVLALGFGILTPPLLNRAKEVVQPERVLSDTTPASTSTGGSNNKSSSLGSTRSLSNPIQNPCSDDILQDFWHEDSVAGFHIVCMEPSKVDSDDDTSLSLTFYKGGVQDAVVRRQVPLPAPWEAVRGVFQDVLKLPSTDGPFQPWAAFSKDGVRIFDGKYQEIGDDGNMAAALTAEYGLLLIYEGGQFLWPGVRLGFTRTTSLYSIMPDGDPDMGGKNSSITLETLSLSPLVLSVKGFLSIDECDHIQELAAPSLEYSGVQLMDQDKGRPASDFRTSQTTFLDARDDIMLDIDYRTASLVRIPRQHQENIQVLRYGKTEHYDSHHDYFDLQYYKEDKSTQMLTRNGNRNRIATVFWYLSDVEEGGETVFPRFHGAQERSYKDCETGLKVKPQKGKVIIFYSLTADGKMDDKSLHGACPVKKGIKWAANKWVWSESMDYI